MTFAKLGHTSQIKQNLKQRHLKDTDMQISSKKYLKWTIFFTAFALLLVTGCASNAPLDTLDPAGRKSSGISDLINPIFNFNSQKYIIPYHLWIDSKKTNLFPFFESLQSYRKADTKSEELNFVQLDMSRLTNTIVSSMPSNVVFVLNIDRCNVSDIKESFNFFENQNILNPPLDTVLSIYP